jgi:hypothetical protein
MTSPQPEINLPPTSLEDISRAPSPTWMMADLKFGRCMTPSSLPASPQIDLPLEMANATGNINRSSSSSSSSDDEAVEAKRLKMDPDYIPSTASDSPQTAVNSQEVSEEEKQLTEQSETEEEDSWNPSTSTSPENISSSEND